MASCGLLVKPSAAKEIEALPKKDRLRVIDRIQALSENPRPPSSEKLSGHDKYRVRQGQYELSILGRTKRLLSASFALLIVGRPIAAASNYGSKPATLKVWSRARLGEPPLEVHRTRDILPAARAAVE